MHTATAEVIDEPRTSTGPERPARRYVPGLSDGLGERVILIDPPPASSLELLRFHKAFSDAPGFEAALRRTVSQLTHFRHPSFAVMRSVERLGTGEDLALISYEVPGRRLSEILPKARGPVFAFELIRSLTPALAALHHAVPQVAHGMLTPERIAVTQEGGLVILEYVVGAALETLQLTAAKLRSSLGVATRVQNDPPAIDHRGDVIQLGLMALSLLLGRRVDPADYPADLTPLLDEAVGDDPTALRLRPWIERALQLTSGSFAGAQDALAAFGELPDDQADASRSQFALMSLRSTGRPFAESSFSEGPVVVQASAEPMKPVAAVRPIAIVPPGKVADDAPRQSRSTKPVEMEPAEPEVEIEYGAVPDARHSRLPRWTMPALAVIAVAEAFVIAFLLYARPPAVTSVVLASPLTGPESQASLPQPSPLAMIPTVAEGSALAIPPVPAVANAAAPAPIAAPVVPERPVVGSASRFGGVTFSSPFEVQIFEGGRLVGSSAGPVALAEGRHVFEVVNETLGFRATYAAEVTGGQMASVPIKAPNGRLSVNAVPWANVSMDGAPLGETPLANLTVPIGTHEFVFRHPQFGEQRQSVAIKAEGLTRVSVNMQR